MADANSSSQWPSDAPGNSKSESSELEALREEAKRLRQLVIQLSRIVIKNAVNMK